MATNLYFSQKVKSEQDLYENVVIESLKMYGQDVFYMPRSIVAEDTVFSEDVVSKFEDAYQIEMYLENIDGYGGDGDLFTKFGVELRDQANFIVAKKRWDEVSASHSSSQVRPNEGDLIFIPLSNSIFEITRVEDERPFYQLSNLPVFRLTCELFEYNDEDFDTDIAAIDDIEGSYAYQYILTLADSAYSSGAFEVGTSVTQSLANGVTITGEIANWNDSSDKLTLVHVGADDGKFHLFTAGTITDASSNTHTVLSTSEDNVIQINNQNDVFETAGDDFLDFSEGNPFGDPT
jgi:hypothetical protein